MSTLNSTNLRSLFIFIWKFSCMFIHILQMPSAAVKQLVNNMTSVWAIVQPFSSSNLQGWFCQVGYLLRLTTLSFPVRTHLASSFSCQLHVILATMFIVSSMASTTDVLLVVFVNILGRALKRRWNLRVRYNNYVVAWARFSTCWQHLRNIYMDTRSALKVPGSRLPHLDWSEVCCTAYHRGCL